MKSFLRFVAIGLVLGLFTEFMFRIIAADNHKAFISAVFLYPVILTLAYAAHKLLDRLISNQWKGDILHYLASGICWSGCRMDFTGKWSG